MKNFIVCTLPVTYRRVGKITQVNDTGFTVSFPESHDNPAYTVLVPKGHNDLMAQVETVVISDFTFCVRVAPENILADVD